MPVLPFGEWLPDQPPYGNEGVVVATNVYPNARGYVPVEQWAALTDATTARPRGAGNAVDTASVVYQYCGDVDTLYCNVGNSWTDYSKVGGYALATESRWEFLQWKNKILAVGGHADDPQQLTLGGTTFSDLIANVRGNTICAIRDHVVFGNTWDNVDGAVPDRVRWSAIGDETDWTVSASTLSDYQDMKAGKVQQLFGGQYGIILMQNSVWRMSYVGSPLVFQFDEIGPNVGCIGPGAAAQFGNSIYFWSDRGFYKIRAGTTIDPIGAHKVDQFALDDLDTDYDYRIYCVADKKRVYWAYPGSGNVGGRPNKIIMYDRILERWSIIEKDVEMIWMASAIGVTLDGLDSYSTDLDALEFSLDSSAWKGGETTQLAAFDENKKSGFFNSAAADMTAKIKTSEMELADGRQAHLTGFSHVVDGGTTTAKVGTRDTQADTVVWTGSITQRSSNVFPVRKSARYHQFEFQVTGTPNYLIGMQIDPWEIRQGGRRGR